MTAGQTPKRLHIGTRGSALALAQAEYVADRLRAAGTEAEIVTIRTPGDADRDKPIAEIGVGVFTNALRDALATGTVDVAVHSFKDLPTGPDPRLTLAAVPAREDPRDVLVARDGHTLGELPPGSVVGTGSPRRAAQLRALGLGLEVVGIRGNVDTRIRKVHDGSVDAVVLAAAGLRRTSNFGAVTEVLDPLQMLPAPAQGALAVECRCEDVDVEYLLGSTLNDPLVRGAVTAERAMLAALEAGCQAPVGALADVVEDLDDAGAVVERISLRGVAATPEDELLRASGLSELAEAERLGRDVAAELLDRGAVSLPSAN